MGPRDPVLRYLRINKTKDFNLCFHSSGKSSKRSVDTSAVLVLLAVLVVYELKWCYH
jgi:hypothetical protein